MVILHFYAIFGTAVRRTTSLWPGSDERCSDVHQTRSTRTPLVRAQLSTLEGAATLPVIRFLQETIYVFPSSASSSSVRSLPRKWNCGRGSEPPPSLVVELLLVCTMLCGAAQSQLMGR